MPVPERTQATGIRGRLPRIPEEQVVPGGSRWPRINTRPLLLGRTSQSRRTRGVYSLRLPSINNSNSSNNASNASGTRNHHSRNREDEYEEYECCSKCYCFELVFLCALRDLSYLRFAYLEPEKKPEPEPENTYTLPPLEAYVKETDELIKKLLSERGMDVK